jgi:hypothetical protein
MVGFTHAPLLPYGQLIDLKGQTFGSIEFLHLDITPPGDIARAAGGDPDPDPDPNPNTCGPYTANTTCDVCLFGQCCAQLLQCDSLACQSYLDCEEQCTDYECVDSCRFSHPTGANEIDQFRNCASDFCGSPCDL